MSVPVEHRISLRDMTASDVPSVLDVQQPGAVIGLARVFPQEQYPFPRGAVSQRWLEEIASPQLDCFVVLDRDVVVGFAAVRADEFMHFGMAVGIWGTGAAEVAHDAVLGRMRADGVKRAWLRVFADNTRGRRFYERLGWAMTGERTRSSFPPCPELLRYERELSARPT